MTEIGSNRTRPTVPVGTRQYCTTVLSTAKYSVQNCSVFPRRYFLAPLIEFLGLFLRSRGPGWACRAVGPSCSRELQRSATGVGGGRIRVHCSSCRPRSPRRGEEGVWKGWYSLVWGRLGLQSFRIRLMLQRYSFFVDFCLSLEV